MNAPQRTLLDVLGPGWAEALAPVAGTISDLGDFLRAERAEGRALLPAGGNVLRAFSAAARRRAGADHRPGPVPDARARGRPVVLGRARRAAAAEEPRQHLPRVRRRPRLSRRRRTATCRRGPTAGVLLLNRVLSVAPGRPGSHRGKGWEAVTEQAIRALVARAAPLVAILWGRDAAACEPLLGDTPCIESAHPSPLSASQRVLRLAPVQQGERAARRAGRRAGRLAPAVAGVRNRSLPSDR